MKIKLTDISELKTFDKYNCTFTQMKHNPQTGWYLYKRESNTGYKQYEVVKGKKCKDEDGSIVYTYPNSESWGKYGYTIDDNWFAEQLIDFIMSAKKRTPEEIYQFKKTLNYVSI